MSASSAAQEDDVALSFGFMDEDIGASVHRHARYSPAIHLFASGTPPRFSRRYESEHDHGSPRPPNTGADMRRRVAAHGSRSNTSAVAAAPRVVANALTRPLSRGVWRFVPATTTSPDSDIPGRLDGSRSQSQGTIHKPGSPESAHSGGVMNRSRTMCGSVRPLTLGRGRAPVGSV